MTLFFWRLTAPLWRVVRFPIVIAVVVCLAAGSQTLTGSFELGRLLQYLPFFVIGLQLRKEHFGWLRTRWARVVAMPVLAGALYLAYVLAPRVDVEWVYWRLGNDELHTKKDATTNTIEVHYTQPDADTPANSQTPAIESRISRTRYVIAPCLSTSSTTALSIMFVPYQNHRYGPFHAL